ncbi:hypothetical protein Tco_1075828 [Tanacetum coccineum]
MANLRYSDKHNMVSFLKKPIESVGFTEIVDFIKGTSLRYALTHNPTIYDSLVKQFWQTATVRTLANGIQELDWPHWGATPYQADEATTIGVGVETEGATTTTTGLDAGLDSGNIHESPLMSYEEPLPEGDTSGSAEDSLNLKELMDIIPKLVLRINNLEKELQQKKSTYGKAVLTLVKRVKLLEAALKRKSIKFILSESKDEETEDQGRKIQDIDDDPLVSLVRNSMEEKDADFFTPKKNVSTYKRRARSASKDKDIGIGMDFFSAAKERLNSAEIKVNISSAGVNTGNTPVSTPNVIQTVNVIVPSLVKSQREGKAPMTLEDVQATQKTKE